MNTLQQIRIVLLVGAAAMTALEEAKAQTFVGEHNGRNWFLTSSSFFPADARAFAVSQGGFLATIRDQEELDWVRGAGVTGIVWTGLSDRFAEGTFNWDDGDASGFRLWGTGEPNNDGDEDNVVINWSSNGAFNDWKWNASAPGLYTIEVVPEPISLLVVSFGCLCLVAKRRK